LAFSIKTIEISQRIGGVHKIIKISLVHKKRTSFMWGSGHNRSLESTSKNVTSEHQAIVVLETIWAPAWCPNGPLEPISGTIAWCSKIMFLLVEVDVPLKLNHINGGINCFGSSLELQLTICRLYKRIFLSQMNNSMSA
jgi:hypothetical protein